MDCSLKCENAIALKQPYSDLSKLISTFLTAGTQVCTPQRKARYSDKQRIRLKDAKSWALRRSGCSNTAEIKKCLKILGKKLDLRLTSAWVAIIKELAEAIENLLIGLKGDRGQLMGAISAYLKHGKAIAFQQKTALITLPFAIPGLVPISIW